MMLDLPDEMTEDMLQPIDDDRAEFMIKLAEDVFRIADDGPSSDLDHEILRLAGSNLVCLVATSLAGYHLYSDYVEMSNNLYKDLKLCYRLLERAAPTIIERLDVSSMKEFEEYSTILPEDMIKKAKESE